VTEDAGVAPPTPEEIKREKNASRVAVLNAMTRMLTGTPVRIPKGRLSVASLAVEAEVNRNQLTKGSLRDLGERFSALIEAQSRPTTAQEVRLSEELDRLKTRHREVTEVHARTVAEKEDWKKATTSLARMVQVLEKENASLRTRNEALRRSVETMQKQTGRRRLESVPPDPEN
jgi:chromosome segregation ATPase